MPLRRPFQAVQKCHAARRNPLKVDSLENREAYASHIQPPPGAEVSVKVAKRRVSGRSAAESLDGHRSGGYGVHDSECSMNSCYGSGLFPLFVSRRQKSVADIHERSIGSERLMAFRITRCRRKLTIRLHSPAVRLSTSECQQNINNTLHKTSLTPSQSMPSLTIWTSSPRTMTMGEAA